MDNMTIETRLMKKVIQKFLNNYIRRVTGTDSVSIYLDDISIQFDGKDGHAWLNTRVDFKSSDVSKLFKIGD